jgi:hypothetical protein
MPNIVCSSMGTRQWFWFELESLRSDIVDDIWPFRDLAQVDEDTAYVAEKDIQ